MSAALKNKPALNGLELKLFAMLTMLVDHTAACGLVQGKAYTVCRIVGRLAFPIYAFLLAEGLRKTKSPRRYALRLLLFAILSEIPFDLAFFGTPWYPAHQNIFWTLLFALLGLWAWRSCLVLRGAGGEALGLLALALTAAGAELLQTDYGFAGVLLVFAMYFWREVQWGSLLYPLGAVIAFAYLWSGIQHYALLAFLPLFFYNGERGRNVPKLLFYAFYPVHLLLLSFFFLLKTGAL